MSNGTLPTLLYAPQNIGVDGRAEGFECAISSKGALNFGRLAFVTRASPNRGWEAPMHLPAFARTLSDQIAGREGTPSRVEMLNMLSRAAGFRNYRHFDNTVTSSRSRRPRCRCC